MRDRSRDSGGESPSLDSDLPFTVHICSIADLTFSTRVQNGSYGEDPEYQEYVKKTPIIFPLIPLYSLKDSKIIK